jgi:hypothetical protein|tara:strand:- start:3880 stop:4182 length:303 start_codon:yes stop_codon:yes gene_type:complete
MNIKMSELRMVIREILLAEQTKQGQKAYAGQLGTGLKVPDSSTGAGKSADQCQIERDEIVSTTAQYNAIAGEDAASQAKKKTLQDQLRVMQQNHDKDCGP